MRTTTYVTFGLVLLIGSTNGGVLAGQMGNMSHTHIGHVMDSFKDTPTQQGLLPTALAEAKTVIQHAGLAAKTPDNLDAMKMHAGHVLHVVDPTLEPKGPGLNYGLKKAASGVANHVMLAAKAEGASKNVTTHAAHVAAAANNTVTRADEIATHAKAIQAATTAADAAKHVTMLNAVAMQLIDGADANKDGKVSWEASEGGLQHVEQHMGLMKKGEAM